MSSIIKGQRIRNESTLEIKQEVIHAAPEEKDEKIEADSGKQQQQDIELKIQKAKSKALMIIDEATGEAKVKADEIIKEGRQRSVVEAQLALEKAQEEGYAKGYEEGRLRAESLIEEGKQIILDANAQKQQILDGIEPEAIEMILKICRKLIDEEINFNKDTILVLIRKALGQVTGDIPEIIIKVAVDEHDYVLENKDSIVSNTTIGDNIQIRPDLNLAEGVCIIETPFGSVECNVNESFTEIKKQMRLIYNEK